MDTPEDTSSTNEGSRPVTPKAEPRSRMPSLNQLAARINIGAPAPAGPTQSLRPRLAASMLRTSSTTSISTVTSNDSMAVNPPSTRSTTPSAITVSPPGSVAGDVGEPVTTENLEKLESQTPVVEPKKTKVGYKNIPSLDAITARLAMARSLSIDGSAKPPDAAMIEDPKTPGFPMQAPEHPLQYTWTIYHDCKGKAVPFTPGPVIEGPSGPHSAFPAESGDYEAGLTVVGEFETVETFCRYFNWLKPPSKLERNSNYHLFKSGIKPMWEDEANANGGKWVLTMKNNAPLLDRCWNWLAMALVGEELEDADEICGAVVSLRSKVDRIQVWTRGKDDVERINSIGKKLVQLLDISDTDGIGLEFQFNTDDRPPPNKYISISSLPATSYRPTFKGGSTYSSPVVGPGEGPTPFNANAINGAFGNFGAGGGAAWRGKKA